MSLYLDKQYINRISTSLDLFSWKKENVAQCRCPICGDSQKSKRKKRFNVYRHQDSLFVKCFNCSYSNLFRLFLKEYFPVEYKEYRRESFFEYSSSNQTYKKQDVEPKKIDYRTSLKLKFCQDESIGLMSKNLMARDTYCVTLVENKESFEYIKKRKIPESYYDSIWFSKNFKKSAESINEEASELLIEEPRLVIPFFNEEGILIGMQGRDLTGRSSRKYITILQNEHCPKIYGLDRINKNIDTYVVEGAFDSMFIKNSVATNDLNLLRYDSENAIYIFDNEYRKIDTVRQIEKAIKLNKKIVLFPKEVIAKDINEMVLKSYDIMSIIKKNTYQGLKAKLRFNQIRGI